MPSTEFLNWPLLAPEVLTIDAGVSGYDAIYTLQAAELAFRRERMVGAFVMLDFVNFAERISRKLVFAHLAALGVPSSIVDFISAMFGAMTFAIDVNNELTDFFPLQRGFPAGSPLSRIMLAVAMDMLSRELSVDKHAEIGVPVGMEFITHIVQGGVCVVVVHSPAAVLALQEPLGRFCQMCGINADSIDVS
ncbi:hypothetical protein GGF43_000467, partial [Coemansia sp. RSA 2618]